ncbi:hypothetical protein ABZX92_14785 [Lentzea sp. NPDC006480]|uniref:hypothetical protein n=1 Tax=Lentzea sp. NPDC006480 TaxID=3157176 RepID=UPI0033A5C7C4
MQDLGQLLVEGLKSGYGIPVFVAVTALLTRRVWVELTLVLRDWVRTAPARRRAALEKKVVDHALGSRSKEQRNHCVEMLRLLLNAPELSLPESPPTDRAPDETPEAPP